MEASDHSLEFKRLETRERQVALAEDGVNAREAGIREEVDHRMAKARADLANEHDLKLKLLEAKAEGRTTALRSRLDKAEQREKIMAVALTSAQANLTSARVDASASLTQRNM